MATITRTTGALTDGAVLSGTRVIFNVLDEQAEQVQALPPSVPASPSKASPVLNSSDSFVRQNPDRTSRAYQSGAWRAREDLLPMSPVWDRHRGPGPPR